MTARRPSWNVLPRLALVVMGLQQGFLILFAYPFLHMSLMKYGLAPDTAQWTAIGILAVMATGSWFLVQLLVQVLQADQDAPGLYRAIWRPNDRPAIKVSDQAAR